MLLPIAGTVPGMNVTAVALTAIRPQEVVYFQNTGRTTTAIGTFVSDYLDPIIVEGSWQFVSRKLIQQWGLNFNNIYGMFYCPQADIMDVRRDLSGDQLVYNGQQYQVEQTPSDFYAEDGWVGVFCVQVPNTLSSRVSTATRKKKK